MNNIKLTKRQEKILQIIVEEYNNLASPIGSNFIIDKYFPCLSSATIRNDMAILEKKNFISKHYASSGRIPTLEGYQYYNEFLDINIVTDQLKQKLHDVLSMRNLSINVVVDKAVEIINENINLPSVILNSSENDLLKKVDFIQISSNFALFIIVVSSGEIVKKEIMFEDNISMDDVAICINIFNDRLVDTPMNQVQDKLKILRDVIKAKVKNNEYIINRLMTQLFDDISWKKHIVKSSNNLLSQPEFVANINKLKKILVLLEDVSIWQQLAAKKKNNNSNVITFNDETGINDVSIAATDINIKNTNHRVFLIGPNRVMYAKANALLKFLKQEMENNFNQNKKTKEKNEQ